MISSRKRALRHRRELSTKRAAELQNHWRSRVETEDRFGRLQIAAGADVGFERRTGTLCAAVAALRLTDLAPVAEAVARVPAAFPYIPGLLSLREVPPVMAACERLGLRPDVLVCDGHGYAHPRRFGLACHLGVAMDTPAIGVAKSRLIGRHEEPGSERGAWSPLLDGEEVIGAVLRTRSGVKPVYVSIGHRIGLESAIELVLRLAPRYRLPETTRRADALATRPGTQGRGEPS